MSLPPAGPEPAQSRDLALLAPDIRDAALRFIVEASRQGIAVRITETIRTRTRQQWLWSIGRTNSHPVSGSVLKLTNAPPGSSKHETGLAFDVVPMIPSPTGASGDYRPTAWWNCPYWEQLGKIGESCGLKWGGRWASPDRPHFEIGE